MRRAVAVSLGTAVKLGERKHYFVQGNVSDFQPGVISRYTENHSCISPHSLLPIRVKRVVEPVFKTGANPLTMSYLGP